MILQVGDMFRRSPLASVRVLLSSNTELRFSIQIESTGPSRTNHTCSPKLNICLLKERNYIQKLFYILILMFKHQHNTLSWISEILQDYVKSLLNFSVQTVIMSSEFVVVSFKT